MDQSAMVYACLGIKYVQKDGLQGYKVLGSYKSQWNKINHDLSSEVDEIPDGSLVRYILLFTSSYCTYVNDRTH